MTIKILYIAVVVILVAGCRKKIVHEITDESEVKWNSVTGDINSTHKLCVFNNELYIARYQLFSSGYECLFKLDGTDQLIDATAGVFLPTSISSSIEDMQVIDGKMYICGNYVYNESFFAVDLMYYDGSSFTPIDFCDASEQDIVNDIEPYFGDLIVAGRFSSSNPQVTTSNTDRLSNYMSIGLSPRLFVKKLAFVQNELYSMGQGGLFESVTKLNGSTWSEVYPNTGGHLFFDCTEFNSDLYVLGKMGNITLKKYNPSNDSWTNFENNELTGSPRKMETIDGILYVYGQYISLDGNNGPSTSIVQYDGSSWKHVGNLTSEVFDLVMFNGVLHAATEFGVYRFD